MGVILTEGNGVMSQKLNAAIFSVLGDLATTIKDALGEGKEFVQMGQDGVFVSVLVEGTVFAEVRVNFETFEDESHWEVSQRLTLWNHSISAHNAERVARLLTEVGARVADAEAKAIRFMKSLPGTRVSSEFEPVVINI